MSTIERPIDVLLLSAEMGEGHNSAARAITETIVEAWPGSRVRQLDTIELRGRRFARLARWAYEFQLKAVPWTYQWMYDVLCDHDSVARATKRAAGWFFGRSLERNLDGLEPDLIISTYPLGSAALDWLRATRDYMVPTVTYIPAFHVHPVWVYGGIDLHFVMYETAAEHARTPAAEPSLSVGAPPVRQAFGQLSRAEARARLGLDDAAFVVLVTGGSLGLGSLYAAVKALVESGHLQVITVCGTNQTLMRRLMALEAPSDRLMVLGYVDTMPELMAAANVVVTNGAGVTVLESLRTARPVIAFQPLAGHGRAATEVMRSLDLAIRCEQVDDLVESLVRLAKDPEFLRQFEVSGQTYADGKDLRHSVEAMRSLVRSPAPVKERTGPPG